MSSPAPAPTAGPRPVDPRVAPLLVRSALEREPSPESLAVLLAIDPASLDGESRVELIEAIERIKAMVDGLQQRALSAVVDATEDAGVEGDLARHEVGAALRLAPVTAAHRTRVAHDMVHLRPATQRALETGRISYQQAAHLTDSVRDLEPEVSEAVEARVLAKAPEQTLAQMSARRPARSCRSTPLRRCVGTGRPQRRARSTGARCRTRWRAGGSPCPPTWPAPPGRR